MEKRLKFYTLLIAVLMSVSLFTSCGDKDDEPNAPGNSELVGSWYFIYEGDIDYNDMFYFGKDGKGYYRYDDERESFTYVYNPDAQVVHLYYADADDEGFALTWYGQNLVEFGGYGTYIRK